jgi:hypothetical protein
VHILPAYPCACCILYYCVAVLLASHTLYNVVLVYPGRFHLYNLVS